MPDINDNDFALWLEIADNFYTLAISEGAVGLNPPSANDSILNLQKKTCYYTAALAS